MGVNTASVVRVVGCGVGTGDIEIGYGVGGGGGAEAIVGVVGQVTAAVAVPAGEGYVRGAGR